MQKIHVMYTARNDGMAINYFYTKEKADRNGNPRFKVYIMDPDAPAVYESIIKCYESQIKEHVTSFIERAFAAC